MVLWINRGWSTWPHMKLCKQTWPPDGSWDLLYMPLKLRVLLSRWEVLITISWYLADTAQAFNLALLQSFAFLMLQLGDTKHKVSKHFPTPSRVLLFYLVLKSLLRRFWTVKGCKKSNGAGFQNEIFSMWGYTYDINATTWIQRLTVWGFPHPPNCSQRNCSWASVSPKNLLENLSWNKTAATPGTLHIGHFLESVV